LRDLPKTREAFSRGEVSYSKVRALSRVASDASEEYFLMIAEHGTAAHLETVVRGVRRDRERRALSDDDARHEERSLRWCWDDHGMLEIRARLSPDQGARFVAALEGAVRAMTAERGEGLAAGASAGAPIELATPPLSYGAKRADALLRLIDGEKSDTEIVVHVSAEALRHDSEEGCCELEDGPALPPESARRLSCDAGIVRLVETPDGQPLDVGRKTRSIPPSLRRALKARDGGCRFPGCDATAHVEGHHVTHWAHGGETAIWNLLSLCGHHHRLVHEGGFSVEHRGDGMFRFHRPDGRVLEDTVPRVVVEGCPQRLIMAANRAHGLVIDADTGACRWDGVPMDRSLAVEGALAAGGEFER
jgi:hypothetical protein